MAAAKGCDSFKVRGLLGALWGAGISEIGRRLAAAAGPAWCTLPLPFTTPPSN
ncbi:hypothetical protein K504DRAFT_459159 [Pleomassaria siparia CBS 279.74]|uniref:Uncharacterized protein n=1 Tax=Pleomassaria siparia CBS 279.74 TaxID=1314801 RepID=A0A6G1K2Y8_9PLEO|nr:hypothetical protein K504DRAFT_459159 [Pleomassaria siparia CBS 279.74]